MEIDDNDGNIIWWELLNWSNKSGQWVSLQQNNLVENDIPLSNKQSAKKVHKVAVFLIVFFSLAVVGLAIGGGLYLHLQINTHANWFAAHAGWFMVGGAGSFFVADIITLAVAYRHAKKQANRFIEDNNQKIIIENREIDTNKEISYNVVSWNIASLDDYARIVQYREHLQNQEKNRQNYVKANQELSEQKPRALEENDFTQRKNMFKQQFFAFAAEGADIICLQESREITNNSKMAGVENYLESILPENYGCFSCKDRNGDNECTIIFNQQKFDLIAYANLVYDINVNQYGVWRNTPNTLILLKDKENGTTICVASTHLQGFALNYKDYSEESEEEGKRKQQEKRKSIAGEFQLQYELNTIKGVTELNETVDLFLYMGDFNVPFQDSSQRFTILNYYHYKTYKCTQPTFLSGDLKDKNDRGPLPVKLDYIYAKGGKNYQMDIKNNDNNNEEKIYNFDRPSDHLPVRAKVVLKKI